MASLHLTVLERLLAHQVAASPAFALRARRTTAKKDVRRGALLCTPRPAGAGRRRLTRSTGTGATTLLRGRSHLTAVKLSSA